MTIVFGHPSASAPVADLHTRSRQIVYRGVYGSDYLDNELFEISRAQWRRRFEDYQPPSDFMVTATRAGETVGLAYASFRLNPELGALLDNLHVEPSLKGGGVGSELLSRVASWLVEHHDAAPLHLEVYAANEAAMLFYERRGGRHVGGYQEQAPGAGTVDVVRYRWDDPSVLLRAKSPGLAS